MPMIGYILSLAIQFYVMIIIVQVAVSWLLAFEIINPQNPQARNLVRLLNRLTDPLYKPLRKYIPPIGGIDITPIIVIFGLSLFERFIIIPVFY
ncbi:MAG: YggT family protein [Alphaproteobacteria bacterium]|nr:YggT family protein [Alphaproteobacteria bacterium]MCD8525643.1 YggT family protein [Alphaproteobacteria bacterium]MCD8570047.1 YggT family protein [Alphaproteobacteria bacterium]